MMLVGVLLMLMVTVVSESSAADGAMYTRWGRKVCPGDALLIYKGYVGGSYYRPPGGGVNYVCLPEEPKWGNYDDRADTLGSYMYGTEYELHTTYNKDIFGPGTANQIYNCNVLCAVCQCKTRQHVLMIPAVNECVSGLTLEYSGYLMTVHRTHNPKDFICVDKHPNTDQGCNVNHNGALLYPVEAKCGALPCPPYVENRELTCAVCTK